MPTIPTLKEALQKIEHYCAYQERCHDEVISKLKSLKLNSNEIDEIIVHLIEHNFLNETRFACSFARGKHRIKFWGKIRIINELKFRNISQYNINLGLAEITPEEYATTFDTLAQRNWDSIRESNIQKKRKKCSDFLLRKGFESNLVYEKIKELEQF
ncbi:regulatory protein RecX [Flavobacterium sp. 123]|uniref:regulatory protein RecX n=1 Tax=Flavobacterium sp. 123 TaxID=2135627 RepID=UPI000EB2D3DB|nr:regulatory protein RecX [Flavobacterium sp. 123]RKS99569.1 regulatory protein [Flavobacterium sp. 123]